MTPGTTVPAALVGVWDGAAVIGFGRRGIAIRRTRGDMWLVWLSPSADAPAATFTVTEKTWPLDLTHRPTRLETIERWRRVTPRATGGIGEPWFGRMHRPDVRYLACGDLHAVAHPVGRPSYLAYAVVVPALADLDPTDDTRLPDGARVVDVRALAIVCQHVFGGPS